MLRDWKYSMVEARRKLWVRDGFTLEFERLDMRLELIKNINKNIILRRQSERSTKDKGSPGA